MDIRRRRRTLLAGLATAALLATGTGAAAADSSTAPAPTGDGAKALCKRVPKIDRRIERALKRLDAGAGIRGSVARLERRVDNAKKAGHTEIATFLEDRLKTRKALVPTLKQRQKDLADVRTWCQDNNGGRAAS
jgi:Spy/CpxP family protein refolding chaperone